MLRRIVTVVILAAFAALVNPAAAAACKSLTAAERTRVVRYLAEYLGSPGGTLGVDRIDQFEGTCYLRLTLVDRSGRHFAMFLSPDHNYVTKELLNTRKDLAQERARARSDTARTLSNGKPPIRGVKGSPVSIVVFSDFQCPYCRRFNELFQALPDSARDNVELVFRHYPLPMHAWAHTAAEATVCAAAQNADWFWSLHDFLFANQSQLTKWNVDNQIEEWAQATNGVNAQKLAECLQAHSAESVLRTDRLLAEQLGIEGTPTVFVNGERMSFRSSGQLQAAIDRLLGTRPLSTMRTSVPSNRLVRVYLPNPCSGRYASDEYVIDQRGNSSPDTSQH